MGFAQDTALTLALRVPTLVPSLLRTFRFPRVLTISKLFFLISKGPPGSINHLHLSMNYYQLSTSNEQVFE